jgi:sugar diacid utilization regulator
MVSATELTAAPALASVLERVDNGDATRTVSGVRLVEELDRIGAVPSGTLVVLTEAASRDTAGYRFDMALRVAAAGGVAGVVVTDPALEELTATAAAICERAHLAVFRARTSCDLADLAIALDRELAGASDAALARIAAAFAALRAAEAAGAGRDGLVAAVAEALGTVVEYREALGDELNAPVIVRGQREGFLAAASLPGRSGKAATELLLYAGAAAVARAIEAARHAEELPARSRAELVAELLQSPSHRTDDLRERARSLGLPIDGWHLVVHVEFDNLLAVADESEPTAYELAETLTRVALETVRAAGGLWHPVRMGRALLLVHMERSDPGPRAGATAQTLAHRVLGRLSRGAPDLVVFCGIGGVHPGPSGLAASAAEARSAVAAARTTGRRNTPVGFDTVGLRRMLIEWYSSDTAREAVETLLAPLDRLGARKRDKAVRTLNAYLDNQGSLSQTARALNLHRNSVAYRIQRIFEMLEANPDDPDERLILQLACRARTLR